MLLSSIRLTIATYKHGAQNVYGPADCSSPYKKYTGVTGGTDQTSGGCSLC